MLRTHHCGEIRKKEVGETVTLCGWVQGIRDKGHLIFIDLRDRYGITQITLEKDSTAPDLFTKALDLGREYVLRVKGVVRERSAKNKHMPTGDIEVSPIDIEVLNKSKVPPFLIEENTDGNEALRMQYRYLDLRREPLKDNLLLRHKVSSKIREYLEKSDFIDIETPLLIKSTPEGARDFVVPSRLYPGTHYALPQSPQLFKQLLMVAGMDRYYQLAKCFRDEDLRVDRQPEFTQIDCEMSFVEQEDVLEIFEGLIRFLFQEVKGITLPPFTRITYAEAMHLYGSDKPDLRWDMLSVDLTGLTKGDGFAPFEKARLVFGLKIPNGSKCSPKKLNRIKSFVKERFPAATPLISLRYVSKNEYKCTVSKFYPEATLAQWVKKSKLKVGDLLLLLGGEPETVRTALEAVRVACIVEQIIVFSHQFFAPVWVTDFPLLAWNETTKLYQALHHPFTAPKEEDIPMLEDKPEAVRSQAYDLVINGIELGSGSIRIHQKALQQKLFKVLGLNKKQVEDQFGFLLQALEYGAPPHGGIAIGLDRLCATMKAGATIRDYIPFPKNSKGRDNMIGAPSLLPEAHDPLHS